MEMIIILLLVVVVMFFMSNRARKKQQAAIDFRNHLEPGQEVLTIDRMYGTVVDVDDERNIITVEATPGVQMRFAREAIASLVEPPEEEEPEELADQEPDPADVAVRDFIVPDDASSLTEDEDSSEESRPERDDKDKDTN